MKHFLVILTTLFSVKSIGQSKSFFHEWEGTSSEFMIVRWNISKDSLSENFVIETTDSLGRVIELKFYENGTANFKRLCYLSPWIKYEYPNDTTVIEYSLAGNGEKEDVLECFVPWKEIYHLSKNQRKILTVEFEYFIDTVFWLNSGMSSDSLNNIIEGNYKGVKDFEETPHIISGYVNSLSKLNGIFPVSAEFDLEFFNFYDAEKREILKALNR